MIADASTLAPARPRQGAHRRLVNPHGAVYLQAVSQRVAMRVYEHADTDIQGVRLRLSPSEARELSAMLLQSASEADEQGARGVHA